MNLPSPNPSRTPFLSPPLHCRGRIALGLAVLALATFGTAARAKVIHVVPGGGGDGTTWTMALDLSAALLAAQTGDEIWVKSGVYRPSSSGNRAASYTLKSGVALYGGFVGNETARTQRNSNPATNGTVLSGDLAGVIAAIYPGIPVPFAERFNYTDKNGYFLVRPGDEWLTVASVGYTSFQCSTKEVPNTVVLKRAPEAIKPARSTRSPSAVD